MVAHAQCGVTTQVKHMVDIELGGPFLITRYMHYALVLFQTFKKFHLQVSTIEDASALRKSQQFPGKWCEMQTWLWDIYGVVNEYIGSLIYQPAWTKFIHNTQMFPIFAKNAFQVWGRLLIFSNLVICMQMPVTVIPQLVPPISTCSSNYRPSNFSSMVPGRACWRFQLQ